MKTPLLKSNLLIKPSIVLAAAVLTAAFLLVPFDRGRGRSHYLMPTGRGGQPDDGMQPFDPNPAAPGSLTRRFLTYGVDSDGTTVPRKTLRITNNTGQTVYPIMRDPNSNTIERTRPWASMTPTIRPTRNTAATSATRRAAKYYFGLKKGESILVSVPLVFWNGARIGIGTDGKYLAPTQDPNPLRYRANRATLHHQDPDQWRHDPERRRDVVSGRYR